MATVILIVLLMAVTAALTVFVTFLLNQDKKHDENLKVRSLQTENHQLKEQCSALQQQYQATQVQWQERWRQVEEYYRPIMNLDAAMKAREVQHREADKQYRAVEEQWQLRLHDIEQRYGPIMSLQDALQRLRADTEQAQQHHQRALAEYESQRQRLISENAQHAVREQLLITEYQNARVTYDRLRHEVALLEENLEDISFGLYKPHFEFDTSEECRRELERVRNAKKEMVRHDLAVRCEVQWHVEGSRAKGEKMQKQGAKIMLRAFNGESDAAIANCRWNNVTRMEERIRRCHVAINRLGTVNQMSIVDEYRDLALTELQLEFEYQDKKRAEAEEQREIRERMREEEKAQRELERAEADTAAEEQRYARALQKARDEVARKQGIVTAEQAARIAELERDLAEAHARHERAVSMAQLTRCGYVYIIPNIGSFGEDMYKIGLTRRLEPMDRVRELGDASVPFTFDVHAMVYSEDAPMLERLLHNHFSKHRVNLVNPRKEFFHLRLEDVEAFVQERGLELKLTKLAEAREYRESLAIRIKAQQASSMGESVIPPAQDTFPHALFSEAVGVG